MSQLNLRKTANKYVRTISSSQNKALSKYSIKLAANETKRNGCSMAWKYYGYLYDDNGVCRTEDRLHCLPCLEVQQKRLANGKSAKEVNIHNIAVTTSSGNLKTHLFKEHGIDIDKSEVSEKQRTLLGNWCTKSVASKTTYDLNRDIVLWFCQDLEAFSMANKQGLTTFLEKNCGIKMPDASSLAKAPLVDMFKTLRQSVIDSLKSVRSATIMFDGWTDKYRKIPFMGTRLATLSDDWEILIYTLNCSPLEGHTADNIKIHMKEILHDFFPNRHDKLKLHSVHDGASNLMKASKLLKIDEPQHCLAHVIHLLLTEDGFKKVPAVQATLEKARNIVSALTYQSFSISQESAIMTKNKIDASEFDKIVECNSILTLDEQYPLEREETESNEASSHTHKTLKMQVATRWNSALMMLESLDCLMDCAMNSLKSLGKFDLLLDEEERDIVHGMVTFLRPFKELTELVSDSNNSLAVIPIVKKRIAELCATNAHDAEEIKSLKKVISGSIDKRFKLSKVATLACMLDPSTRDHIFKKDDVLKTLSKAAKALDNDEDENSSQNLPQSKKMKLLSAIKESTVDDRQCWK
jgi:hypothetical protein